MQLLAALLTVYTMAGFLLAVRMLTERDERYRWWLVATAALVFAVAKVLEGGARIFQRVGTVDHRNEPAGVEPPRDCRRPFGLSYAATGVSSSIS